MKISIVAFPTEVEFSVINHGQTIQHPLLSHISSQLVRGKRPNNGSGGEGSPGLGLYVARQMALAPGGDINVHSDDTKTIFTVRLPRLSGKEDTYTPY